MLWDVTLWCSVSGLRRFGRTLRLVNERSRSLKNNQTAMRSHTPEKQDDKSLEFGPLCCFAPYNICGNMVHLSSYG